MAAMTGAEPIPIQEPGPSAGAETGGFGLCLTGTATEVHWDAGARRCKISQLDHCGDPPNSQLLQPTLSWPNAC